MRSWLKRAEATRRIIKDNYQHLSDNDLLVAAVEENVLVQLENLQTHPVVASALARGALRLHGWVYKIETGEVFAYNPEAGQFLPLVDATAVPALPHARGDLRATLTSKERFQPA